ncbi:DUF4179 domain-containing protein [Sporosarcina sp. FSL W8-0480]|uniref:DUF4179 domain-containing protein n=1 Tax=Sporosarcina sp. FSL W8-0480 TaxID=2954701 RepID=UPI0030DB7351
MKDVYDHLNDIDMDANQFVVEDVSEAEKTKVMLDLKRKISRPKPVRWRKIAAAATISIGLSSAALFGLSFTSFAQEIPIIGQVFKWFNDDGFFENYSEHANTLSMTQEDNGISITLNEAVFDGKTLYVAYEIISEIDLGDDPSLKGMPAILNSDGGHLATGSHDIKKVDDFRYVGVSTAKMYPENRVEEGSFEFDITGIFLETSNVDVSRIISDPTYSMKEIAGSWKFQFDLQATDNVEQSVGLTSAGNDVTVSMNKIVYTPMSFILFYEEIITEELDAKWDFVSVSVDVKDDLGHTYATYVNGGESDSALRLYHTHTLEKLDPKAKRLIVTPTVVLSQRDGTYENGAYYRNENSTAPMEEFELDEIVIEIEK